METQVVYISYGTDTVYVSKYVKSRGEAKRWKIHWMKTILQEM
jgi:hypothetical protein